ncbi:hypothetical protein GCM10023196_083410 [Actinoallomurus vinaceus]|uniref:Autotransporter n=1 Tax=Actinoallomurus vinaceus TaxID=1080074 RepID=A0ABP8UNE0_9ACTN
MVAAVVLGVVPGAPAARAVAVPADITAAIYADRNVTLAGDAVVRLTGGTTTYSGVIGGVGTLTVTGTGTLVLTKDSDFLIPPSQRREKVTTSGGPHPVTTISNPDPPAVIVDRGATLQYGPGPGASGVIGHFDERPGLTLNHLNIRVDGHLDVAVHRALHLGIMSGSGFISARRATWPGLVLAGDHPFSGVLYNGTVIQFGATTYMTRLPNVRKIVNQGSAIHDMPLGRRLVDGADYDSRNWGNDINFHSRPGGMVVMTGVYSWADRGSDANPWLSDPALNFRVVPHNDNKRGVNIEGANVQWGDGTHHRFFLPGNKNTVYINMHQARTRSRLTFDYNGPVSLGAPISGGIYHDTLSAPGLGDVVIAGTRGNDVTFAAPQNYDGATTIGRGAVLRLGTGGPGGDGSLRTRSSYYRIIDNGVLVVQNSKTALTLSRISGAGSFTQAGRSTTTLTGRITYTGATTVAGGTLALRGGTLANSSGVALTKPGAGLDLTRAGKQTFTGLSQAAGSTLKLGRLPLTVTGRVAVHGNLVIAPGTVSRTARQVTLVDTTGTQPVSGSFRGLPEGTSLTVAGRKLHISYRGGDGNDVVLTTRSIAVDQQTGSARGKRLASKASHWHVATGLALALFLMFVLVLILGLHRTRRQRRHTTPLGNGHAGDRPR